MLPPSFLDELRGRTSLVDVVGARVVLRRRGREHVGCCPFHGEKTPSLTVNEAKGFVHCFGCGAHGDAIGFVMRHDNVEFMDAVRHLAALAGMPVPGDEARAMGGDAGKPLAPIIKRPAPEDQDRDKDRIIEWARGVWRDARPWRGTLVETYLTRRGVCPPDDLPSLRFVASLKYRDRWPDDRPCNGHHPAMVAAVQGPDGRITGIHRTYLAPDGAKADVPVVKKMGGVMWGGAIRMARAGRVLAVGEGIETVLAVRLALPDLPLWAAGSLGNMAGSGDPDGPTMAHPTRADKRLPTVMPDMGRPGLIIPDFVNELILLGDADGDRPTCEALIERAARRHFRRGRVVRVAWPRDGMDFNDLLMGEVV